MVNILIVDDSSFFRSFIERGLENYKDIKILSHASDPYEARDKIVELRPDVMVLDIKMPKMNGIEFLKKLMPQYPMPVIVISALNNKLFEALEAGAIDFVEKPTRIDEDNEKIFIQELAKKIKIASKANIKNSNINLPNNKNLNKQLYKLVAIGASTGGTEAIFKILKEIPKEFPPIVICQHMPPNFTKMYAQRLDGVCKINVKEGEDGEEIKRGYAYIAPGNFQMKVINVSGRFKLQCFKSERVNGHSPSVDVLFDSVADLTHKNMIAILLTGMGKDGALGLLKIRQKGGFTIGQDEQSSVVYGMPKEAYTIGAVVSQLSLDKIASKIISLVG